MISLHTQKKTLFQHKKKKKFFFVWSGNEIKGSSPLRGAGAHEPSTEHLKVVKGLLDIARNSKDDEYEKINVAIREQFEAACEQDLHFTLDDDSKMMLHAHLFDLVMYVAGGV